MSQWTALTLVALAGALAAAAPAGSTARFMPCPLKWRHLSSAGGELPVPVTGTQQTASLVCDIDGDGLNDIVIAERTKSPALVWLRRTEKGWVRYVIDEGPLPIEAGGAFHDIDGDGDVDLVFGGDWRSEKVWWWENPRPNYDPGRPWKRREIKSDGARQHHDQIFGDFDGDGRAELVFWNQGARKLLWAPVPADPTVSPWPLREIFSHPKLKHEGLAKADIDGDGRPELIGGGMWFKYRNGTFIAHVIDEKQAVGRAAAGLFRKGARPAVLFCLGETTGRLMMYECEGDPGAGGRWRGRDLLGVDVDHGHTLEVADVDGDGNLDILCAEMRLNGANEHARMWLLLGDGQGGFTPTVMAQGLCNHESRLADLDGDGRIDVLGKPYNWQTPRLDIWLNMGR